MDLKLFTNEIEINLKELPDVSFFCTRPRLEDMEPIAGSTHKRVKNIWENNIKDWSGLEMSGKPFSCNPENKKELLKINSLLVLAVCNKLAESWSQEFSLETGN